MEFTREQTEIIIDALETENLIDNLKSHNDSTAILELVNFFKSYYKHKWGESFNV